jgi:hypothetical protein
MRGAVTIRLYPQNCAQSERQGYFRNIADPDH